MLPQQVNRQVVRLIFFGTVNDVLCSISVDGQGSDANVYLAPVSISEVKTATPDTLLKPKSFIIDVSNCQAASSSEGGDTPSINVKWIGGNMASENGYGYLINSEGDAGAKNIQFALATDSDSTLKNKIIPGSESQPQSKSDLTALTDGSRFTYYVGYVTQSPESVTVGKLKSYATYEVTYE